MADGTSESRRVDLDELARLEEQRDHLLSSLKDIENEHAVGDMDDVDYQALKDDYTVRAADVLRALDAGASSLDQARRPTMGRARAALIFVGILGFAVVAGITVAKTSGQRGDNAITGSAGPLREQLATCQPLSFQEPEKGIKCYEKILEKAPDNLEALTYQGWAQVRAERVDEATKNFDRVVELDPGYSDVRVFRAVVATRQGDFAAAAAEVSKFYANDPSPMAIQVLQSQGLEQKIFFGDMSPATTACWKAAAAESEGKKQLDSAFYGTLGSCLDVVLTATPRDTDALVSKAFTLVGAEKPDPKKALELLDLAIGFESGDTNALLMRASLRTASGDTDGARADLAALKGHDRPTISFLTGGPEQVQAVLDQPEPTSTEAGTTPPDPSAPNVPNRSGG
ncbi:MAG: tetratricopeptide repeat protein [Microthrixaceae bacterium]